MRYGFWLVAAVWVLQTIHVCAQQGTGQVTDLQGLPVRRAQVELLNTPWRALTDSIGFFELPAHLTGQYQLLVQREGYAAKVAPIQLPATSAVVIQLAPEFLALPEVVVTAEKRAEPQNQLPLAVTILDAERLQQTRTWGLNQLVGLVPNLQYGDLGVGYQQQIALRGISVFSDDPAVATYVDGVVSMDIAANGFLLMDVARIEVLRGPQGTLYGRNAMGGVINIITKLPADTLQVYAESGLGNQGLQRWNAALRLPIVKHKLMLSVAGGYQTQHGFNRNDLSDKLTFRLDSLKGSPEDGQRVGDAEAFYLNVALRWVPGKRWLATLQVKTQTDRSLGASSYFQAAENDSIAFARPYTFAVNDLGRHQRQVYNTSLLLRWFHPKFTFSSISAHQYVLQAYEGIDQDLFHWDYASGASFDGSRLGRPYPQGVLSQEWKLSAPADASRLQWTAGLYLFQQRYNRQQATVYKRLAYLFGGAPGTEVVQTNRLNWGAAAFGQVSYALWAHMKLTAGLRYDYESRRATTGTFRLQTDGSRDYSRPDTTRQLAFGALSPKLALSYQSGQHHTYVSYTRGYRVGGLNMNSPLPDFQAFTPEYSDNYELGYRVANRRNTWQVSATLFHLYWRSMQLEVQPTPGVWVTDNIGNARSQGAELELLARPWPGATIEATGGFNQAYYQDFVYLNENIKGNRTILAPTHTGLFAFMQQLPVGKRLLVAPRVEVRAVGKQYFDLVNRIAQQPYQLVNAYLNISSGNATLSFWVLNLQDTRYLTYAMPGYFRYALLNRPREYGLTLSTTF